MPKKQNSKKSQNKQNGGAYYLGVSSPRIGGLAEVVRVDDPIPPSVSHASGNNYPEPLYLQGGKGYNAYSHIVNPLTNRKVKVNSTLGRTLVKQYSNLAFKSQKGGAEGLPSIFTGNMLERTFTGKQPEWIPSDI
jgi:hypothetical protein